ncbi:MAG TPA: TIM barrel protein [Victivallales bacterium]|nr:TIM barrel protein [Victivallales bacterium]
MKNLIALNRMLCPNLSIADFFKLANEMGCSGVELRNDINDGRIIDDLEPEEVKSLAELNDINIYTINAVQKFNLASKREQVMTDLNSLIEISKKIGCKAIVLCPNNEADDNSSKEQCYSETVSALKAIGNALEGTNIIGLVEPLGFEISSLRYKKDAVSAIRESGYADNFKIVHDTFHHYLAGEKEIFPEETGLVHFSGVEDKLPASELTDENRVFITEKDIMHNVYQINSLADDSYLGILSFEPFSSRIHDLSLDVMKSNLRKTIKTIANI